VRGFDSLFFSLVMIHTPDQDRDEIVETLVDLKPGNYIQYEELLEVLEESEIFVDVERIYSDGAGFLVEWHIADGSVVIDALNEDPMIRDTNLDYHHFNFE